MNATTEHTKAALNICLAVGDAIKAAGVERIPSGHLYAMLTGKLSLSDYEAVIRMLKNVGAATESGHVLRWSGK